MAKNTCTFIPKAQNGKDSKLFHDLQSHIGVREDAKIIWGLTTTDLFKSAYNNEEKDENGEITYNALNKILNLDSFINSDKKEINKAKDLGLINQYGQPVEFKNASAALELAKEFNSSAKKNIAIVYKERNKYKTRIGTNTPLLFAEADINEARRKLNVSLIKMLQNIGFNIEFTNNPDYYGVFDPLFAEKNAENIRTIIQISKNEKGLDAISEEISHVILAGLKDNALKQRLDAIFTDEIVKQVLGEEYDSYNNKYKNSNNSKRLMQEEAQGKFLRDVLTGKELPNINNKSGATSIIKRLWNFIKSVFSRINTENVDNAFVNAKNAMLSIKEQIDRGEVEEILSKRQIESHERLYSLNNTLVSMQQAADQGEVILSRKLYILEQTQKINKKEKQHIKQSIEEIREDLLNKRYEKACLNVLITIGNDIINLQDKIKEKNLLNSKSTDLNTICEYADLVEKYSTAIQAYTPYIKMLQSLPDLISRGQIEITPGFDVKSIIDLSTRYMSIITAMQEELSQIRLAVLKQLVSLYYGNYGEKPEHITENHKYKWESVDTILTYTEKDINWWDTNMFSAGDSRNPLINVVHAIIARQQAARNNRINSYFMRMQAAEAKLQAAGHSNDFVYELDEKGLPTGYYISDRDFYNYEKEREDFKFKLQQDGKNFYEIQNELLKFDIQNTEKVAVGKDKDGNIRYEYMPKIDPARKNFSAKWTDAQKEYYKTILEIKAEMDSFLPSVHQHLYKVPYVRKSVSQMFDKNGRGAFKTLWSNWKQKYTITDDNEDYKKSIDVLDSDGNPIKDKDGNIYILEDFDGKELKRVPVYFVKPFADMQDLSTDASRAMCNYIAMSIHFNEIGKLSSSMRLLKNHIATNYSVRQSRRGKVLKSMFKSFGTTYEKEYSKLGYETKTVKTLSEYIDRQMFNDLKEEHGKIIFKVKDTAITTDSMFELFMRATSISRMGFNILSGITNITQGETQLLNEASTKRFFSYKSLASAKKKYFQLLPNYLMQFNSIERTDRMSLLINQFNSSEDFFRDMKDKNFNKSAFKRVLGRGNVYFLNTMGEHELHTTGLLAVLEEEKVKRVSDNKIVSLYDVIVEAKDPKTGATRLELSDDIIFINPDKAFLSTSYFSVKEGQVVRKEDRDKLFESLAVYVNNINAGMFGGYSDLEKGNINRQMLGRAILQFRQWMFGLYNKNFSGKYYDAILNDTKEGSYTSIFRFFEGVIHDWKNVSLKFALENNNLTDAEKRNIRNALSQSSIFVSLVLFGSVTNRWKDEDDRALRLLAYQLKRLELETGALVPFPPTFVANMLTLIQSPAAGFKTLESWATLLNFKYLMTDLESGRYKGWNRATKALFTTTPIYNIMKVIDMKDYNYMFNIFN